MAHIEGQPVPRTQVYVEPAQLIVVPIAIHRVDSEVLKPARKTRRIRLGEILQILQSDRILMTLWNDVIGKWLEGRLRPRKHSRGWVVDGVVVRVGNVQQCR